MSSSLQKTEAIFCTKVSRINNKRCAELLENFAGRQQEEEQGAAGTMGLPWQPLPATELCTLGLSGWVMPTPHKSHGALQPRGIAAHHALRGIEAAEVCEPHRRWVILWWALGMPGLLASTSHCQVCLRKPPRLVAATVGALLVYITACLQCSSFSPPPPSFPPLNCLCIFSHVRT